MKITPDIKTAQDVQLALIDQGYGTDYPDVIDNHPSVLKRQALKTEALHELYLKLRQHSI